MPVRSLTQSVLRWPKPEQVLAEAQAWAQTQQQAHPSLRRVGVFGRYAAAPLPWAATLTCCCWMTAPKARNSNAFAVGPHEQLPLACDALVLTSAELDQLLARVAGMALELRRDLRWLDELPEG